MIWAGMLNHPVGWINYRTGELYIDFSLAPTAEIVKESTETETVPKTNAEGGDAGADVITTSKYKEYPTDGAWFLAKWQSVLPSGTWRHTVYLGTPEPAALNVSRGALREGKTTFVAFLDEDGDGAWTPGEPYGVTTGVDVGWFGTSCEIELSRTASQVTRMNVPAVAGSSDFNAANDLTDRRVVGAWTAANIESGLTSEADLSTRVVRMRILRTLVNGERFRSGAISADGAAITYDEVVYDRKIDFATHPLLTEETVLTAGMFDLDWGTLTDAWLASGKGSIGGLTNVAYRIVLGEGSDVLEDGNGLPLMFVNAFENGLEQTAAIPVEPNGGKVHSARPTFRWRHPNPIGKSYPAFRLRVWSPDDDANPVYDSGVQPAPARTDDDVYEWTAPLCAGMVTPNGWVFGATNQYIWTVSMLDAKYIEPNASEARCRFQMDVDGQVAGGDSDYGALDVCVRYYGPTEAKAVTTSPTLGGKTETVTNIIRVQAFTAPDFAGDPAGEAYVTNVTDLASLTDVTTANARIRGLKPGAYYVRTFIDSDADGVWSRWETWGYANYVGDANAEYLYMPRAAVVTAGIAAKTVTVYMEDMDTNLDRKPDADEFSRWGAIGTSAITVISADGSQFVPEVCVLEDGSLTDSWLDVTLHPAPADIGKSVTLTLAVTRPLGEETVWPTLCMDGTALAWEEAEVTNAAGVATARVYTLSGVTDAVTRIYLDRNSLDGAERSVYTVKVSSDAADQYDRSEFRFSVTNVAPVIGPTEYGNDSLTNAVAVHLGDAFTIPVTIDDVPADVAAGLIVVWRGDGLFSVDGAAAVVTGNGFLSETNGMPVVTERVAGNYAFTFAGGSSGLRAVTLQVTDKDGGVAERTYWYNVIAPEDDFDNDGLDNWIEESLIPEAGFDPTSFTEPWSFDGQQVPDYFLAAGSSYLGFMFTDHDFMDDWWEDLFDPDYVSRYPFDAWDDPDQDGWSNWAEARAGTDPTQTMSMVLDGDSIFEVPTPTIRLRVVYPNVKTAISASNLVVQAYGDRESFENGAPNAVWSVPIVEAQPFTRNLGVNPGGTVRLNLGPGSVVPGSVSVAFRDPNTVLHAADGTYMMLDAASAPWVPGLNEYFVPGETPLLVRVTPDQPVGTIDYETGDVVMDLARMQDYLYSVDGDKSYQFFEPGASNEWKRLDLSKSYMQIRWNGKVLSDGRKWETSLSEPNVLGHLREGKTMFVVFADGDGNGLWTPGEPYGVVTDIDVGWAGTSVEVELTDISSRILRMDLEPLVNAKDLVAANEATDRGVLSDYAYYPNEAAKYYGTNDIGKVLVRVRVVRSWFNGEKTNATFVAAASGNVFEGMFDLRGHPCLTEADLLARDLLDLDWGTIKSAWDNAYADSGAPIAGLTNVAYRIVLGNGTESGTTGELNNLVPLVFYNAFEYGRSQTLAQPVSPAGAVCSAQPTFTWTHEAKDATGRTIKDYPAFQLRVWKQDGTTLVYDSGIRPAPARNVVDGSYSWTAPIYPDMVTPQGHIFSTTNNYKWSVSMLDAKFTTPNGNETKMEFRLETSGALGTISDYGAARACVRYYGPAKLSANAAALTNIIRVQAFTSPDFTGTPAGEAYVTTTNSINSATDVTTANALILGLKPGMYYLRAFVDSDGDCDWSRWETWGYANYVSDTNAVYRYTPRAVAVEKGAPVPMAVIFMEDMDTDRDYLPDAMEWNLYTSLAKRSAPTGNTFFTRVNPTFATSVQGFARNSAIQTANAPLRLMSAGPQAENLAFLALPASVAAELTAPDAVQVRISSFSLAGGVSLTVSSSLTPGDYGALTVTENDDVNVYLVAAKTPDFADAKETLVKTGITIKANDETKEVVSAAELKAAIEAADLSDAAFFKVRIEK